MGSALHCYVGRVGVLNALRHQRFGITCDRGLSSRSSGAQRLTASEVWHDVPRSRGLGEGRVLNALRHQRFGMAEGKARRRVTMKCSTPYGIRGLASESFPAAEPVRGCAQRLTASEVWHTRLRISTEGRINRAQRLTASEVWHSGLLAEYRFDQSAQRLTASEVWHMPKMDGFRLMSLCSTPYGIRGLA